MNEIKKLTPDQKKQIEIYRNKHWRQAVCTDPADRPRAEKAARRLAEIGGIAVGEIMWGVDPASCVSLWDSLRDSLRDSLWDSLMDSLRDSLMDSLRDSLWDSLRDSLRDSPRLAYYTHAVEVLGIKISDQQRELLNLYNEIAASCFAVWILPGTVVLCERPATVEIDGDKLVDLAWRPATEGGEE